MATRISTPRASAWICGLIFDATEDHGAGKRDVFAVGLDAFFHLGGEFARRGQDQGADGPSRHWGAGRRGQESLQTRQGEACGLASSGLGAGKHIATLENHGDGLCLDGSRDGIAGIGNGAKQFGAEAERVKGQNSCLWRPSCVRFRYGSGLVEKSG